MDSENRNNIEDDNRFETCAKCGCLMRGVELGAVCDSCGHVEYDF